MLLIETRSDKLHSLKMVREKIAESNLFNNSNIEIDIKKSLLLIHRKKSNLSIEVNPSFAVTPDTHGHKQISTELLNIWMVSTYPYYSFKTKKIRLENMADAYVFNSSHNIEQNIIVTASELFLILQERIEHYLKTLKKNEKLDYSNEWDLCDRCFGHFLEYNNWSKLALLINYDHEF